MLIIFLKLVQSTVISQSLHFSLQKTIPFLLNAARYDLFRSTPPPFSSIKKYCSLSQIDSTVYVASL